MTLANTEYSQALVAVKKFSIDSRDGTAFRLAYVTGKVAGSVSPYLSVGTGQLYHEDGLNFTGTLYFACSVAGKIAEIVAWT
jgi:hypothetical protein